MEANANICFAALLDFHSVIGVIYSIIILKWSFDYNRPAGHMAREFQVHPQVRFAWGG